MNGFSVRDVVSSAWKNIKGTKWPIWSVLLVLFLIAITLTTITGLITGSMGVFMIQGGKISIGHTFGYVFTAVLFEIIVIYLTAPLTAGAQMVALKKSRGESVSATTGFGFWGKWLSLGTTIILFTIGIILVYLVFTLLTVLTAFGAVWLGVIFGALGVIAVVLYYTFFLFNLLFVADKGKGPFAALVCSAKAVAQHWFRVLLIWIYVVLACVVTMLPLFLAMTCPIGWIKAAGAIISFVLVIWLIPYLHLILATAYNKLSSHIQ